MTVTGPDGKTEKLVETFSCGHCQHVTEAPHGQTLDDLGCFCLACMRPCCAECSTKMARGGMCDPFERKLEREEAWAASLRSMTIGETNTA